MELKTEALFCDRCSAFGGVVLYIHSMPIPHGWDYRETGPHGMTDYTRTDLLCDDCLQKEQPLLHVFGTGGAAQVCRCPLGRNHI